MCQERCTELTCSGGADFSNIEIVFCFDTTGSMSSYLRQAKDVVDAIIVKAAELSVENSIDVSLGFVAYKDHPPEDFTYVTQFQDLSDPGVIKDFIGTLSASGGGDFPEAAMDGLYDSIFLTSWSETAAKYIFLVTDAVPHGTRFRPEGVSFRD